MMNKEEKNKIFKNNPIKSIKIGDMEIPVEFLSQTNVIVDGDNYIRLLLENEKLKNDYNKLVHEATEFESKIYQLQEENKRWDMLKEWIKDYQGILKIQEDTVGGLDVFEEYTLLILNDITVAMEEMEDRKDERY